MTLRKIMLNTLYELYSKQINKLFINNIDCLRKFYLKKKTYLF